MNTQWISTVDDDGVLSLPEDLLIQLDWREGDILDFDLKDEAVILRNITAEERDAGKIA